ncbi:hypothetical protein [Streptomyces coffeae]|uniref:Uncharacterized protein n=1 Tax=Streptomyces coffeae TaxID=621382 RepID=A0ABS1N9Y4_9ACTN|nr:hypothetical protein [Streptomyces coffeae]MBL1096889.1 hypothetical protein [Streptomyces coffeae]
MSALSPVPGPLPEDVADLLRAVLEALDIPHPATVGDSEERARVLTDRAMHAAITLRGILNEEAADRLDIEWETAYLRERLAKHPPTSYRAWDPPPLPPALSCNTEDDGAEFESFAWEHGDLREGGEAGR